MFLSIHFKIKNAPHSKLSKKNSSNGEHRRNFVYAIFLLSTGLERGLRVFLTSALDA